MKQPWKCPTSPSVYKPVLSIKVSHSPYSFLTANRTNGLKYSNTPKRNDEQKLGD